jgi:hypothetical protein
MASQDDEYRSRNFPVQEDISLQTKLWKGERVGWYVFSAILILTMAGLFGTGPLSTTTTRSASGTLNVEYDKFERNGAANQMVITTRADRNGKVWLVINGALFQKFTIESIQPEPSAYESFLNGVRLELTPDPEGWATAYIGLRPTGLGVARTTIYTGGESVEFRQFIYP